MSASSRCHHPGLDYRMTTFKLDGDDRTYTRIKSVVCPSCGAKFRFVGVEPSNDPGVPSSNRNATELMIPMVEIGA